jgi:hypothetical protein
VVAGDGTADITPFAINYSPLSLAGGANVRREVVRGMTTTTAKIHS